MKKVKLNNKGITLLVLSITIIVLLILTTVSIRFVANQGIVDKTQGQVNKYNEYQIKERILASHTDYKSERLANSSYTFAEALDEEGVIYKSLNGNDEEGYEITVELKDGEKTYIISADGSISAPKTLEDYGLKIGDYVNYDPTKDKDGNTVAKTTYISYSKTNADSSKNNGRTSGYSENQVFQVSAYTRRLESIRC